MSKKQFPTFATARFGMESDAFKSFVVSYGRLLPLAKPSTFAEKDIVQKLTA